MDNSAPCFRIAICLLLGALASCGSNPPGGLSPEVVSAIRALEDAYVSGWVRNDREAVLATLEPDAVLLPGGMEPLEGLDAIQVFWWPAEGPATTVTAYETTIEEVGGGAGVAYVRGRGELTFSWQDGQGGGGEQTNRSVFLMIARESPDGTWRIARRMWSSIQG